MKAEDLKTKTQDELQKMLLDARKGQMNLRFQRSGGQLENTAEIRRTRRDIARIKTFLSAQKNGAAEAAKPKASTSKTSTKTPAKAPKKKSKAEKAA